MPKEWNNTIDVSAPVQATALGTNRALHKSVDLVGKRSDGYVPVFTRRTKKSRATAVAGTRGAVGYANRKAAMLHENPKGRRYRNGKRAKFLERALTESVPDVRAIAVGELRRALRGG